MGVRAAGARARRAAGRRGARWAWAACVLAACGAVAMTAGCAREKTATVVDEPVLPSAELAARALERYNARAASIGSVWSRTVITLWHPDEKGEEQSDQVEGHFNVRTPRGLVLTFMKAGELGGVLGSGEENFWWLEVRDPKRGLVGTHAGARPERIAELGLPVHPLDLIDVLGVTAMDPQSVRAGAARAGDPAGSVWLASPARWGTRLARVDAETGEPQRVELVDAGGRVALWAELSRPEAVPWRGAPERAPAAWRMPTDILLVMEEQRLRARLRLYEPESGSARRPDPRVFTLATWTRGYGVTDLTDLDLPAPAGAADGGRADAPRAGP